MAMSVFIHGFLRNEKLHTPSLRVRRTVANIIETTCSVPNVRVFVFLEIYFKYLNVVLYSESRLLHVNNTPSTIRANYV